MAAPSVSLCDWRESIPLKGIERQKYHKYKFVLRDEMPYRLKFVMDRVVGALGLVWEQTKHIAASCSIAISLTGAVANDVSTGLIGIDESLIKTILNVSPESRYMLYSLLFDIEICVFKTRVRTGFLRKAAT